MAKLSSDKKSVTVQKGDTLSQIALDYKSYSGGKTYQQLATLNGISNPNRIYVGQVIKLTGTNTTTTTNSSNKVKIKAFGLQSDTDSTVFATWTWTKDHTKGYRHRWKYQTSDGTWFLGNDTGNDSSDKETESVYNAPTNAVKVAFKVKPIATTHKVNNKDTAWWTGDWTDYKYYNFADNPPEVPPTPTVEIDTKSSTLTATVTGLRDINATHIEFQVVKNDSSTFATTKVAIKTESATYKVAVSSGNVFKVRCRAVRNNLKSDWSEYSSNSGTQPSAPSKITSCKARDETSVSLAWSEVKNVESYDVEYTTNRDYFDSASGTTTKSGIETNSCIIDGLESGETYYFRVRAVNEYGESVWSGIKSTAIGKKPSAPTTWSSTTTTTVDEPLSLYWVHNAEDNSSQTAAILELIVNGTNITGQLGLMITNTTDEDERDKTSYVVITYKNSYLIVTDRFGKVWLNKKVTDYGDGAELKWRVQTCGVTSEFGDYSVQRTVKIYATPTLELGLTYQNGDEMTTLGSFPFYISCEAGPNTQVPISYHLAVVANDTYETTDQIGNTEIVTAGQTIYSKYFDNPNEIIIRNEDGNLEYVTSNGTPSEFLIELSAGNIDLENNVSYTVTGTVSMNSGLTASASKEFTVIWDEVPHLHLEISNAGSTGNRIYYDTARFSHVPDNTYTLSFRARSDDDAVLVSCVAGDSANNPENYFLTSNWQEYSFTYTTAVGGSITFWLRDANTSADITDIKLVLDDQDESLLVEDAGESAKYWTTVGAISCRAMNVGYQPNAEIGIDYDNVSAFIRPYCEDENGDIIEGVTLAVFRREFDGSFTEIGSDITNSKSTFVTDPHPSLDYARYRIVATTDTTGAVGYYDVPGYPVNESAVIIQWDEQWSNFETSEEDEIETPSWAGSLLRLPYNIDVSDKYNPDISLVEYIGREHPVSYYGTQRGMTSTWNVTIPKEDKDTIYALRRLANWMGDVYVREPSGTGYWATINVSFPIKHLSVSTTVTFDVTRVEGGI